MTGIQWTDQVWNPTTGCDRVSPGCDNCYALTMAGRLKGMGSAKYQRDGDPATSGPGFRLTVHPSAVNLPLTWRKPRRVFVNSMSDLFHADVPEPWLADIFAVMAAAPQHTFQVLTKRHARMRSVLSDAGFIDAVYDRAVMGKGANADTWTWPLPNVWIGVSAEDQHWADIRIPALLETPAAVRWVSAEPLLGPVDFHGPIVGQSDVTGPVPGYGHRPKLNYWLGAGRPYFPDPVQGVEISGSISTKPTLDWIVLGGESGPGARPCDPVWIRSIVWQCWETKTPLYVKQMGSAWAKTKPAKHSKGGDPAEWPADLRPRQYPDTSGGQR